MTLTMKRSLSSKALFVWACSAIFVPVLMQNPSVAQQARAWGPGETPAQAASRVVTEEQTLNVNGIDKEVRKGEVINLPESGAAVRLNVGKEAVLKNGTKILKDGTTVSPDGTAVTMDGTTVSPDGREVVKADKGKAKSILAPDSPAQTQGSATTKYDLFKASVTCYTDRFDVQSVTFLLTSQVDADVIIFARELAFYYDVGLPDFRVGPDQGLDVVYESIKTTDPKALVSVIGSVNGRSPDGDILYLFFIPPGTLVADCT